MRFRFKMPACFLKCCKLLLEFEHLKLFLLEYGKGCFDLCYCV